MSVTTTVNQINTATLEYLPAVLAGVQAAEQVAPGLPGETKAQAVVNGIIAGSAVLAGDANPNVAGIAALVNLVVSILNAAKIFRHKAVAGTA
jgi:hypothetical protein